MKFLEVLGMKDKIIIDRDKAILLNTYVKLKYIKYISNTSNTVTIEIINNSPIIKESILKA